MLGLGNNLNELKIRIKKAQQELAQLGSPEPPLPEMIANTNLIRMNDYLAKSDEQKTKLIDAYKEYTKQLEEIVTSLLSIQSDLQDIVRTEAKIIGTSRKKPRKAPKKAKKARKARK
jgi:hypothetical protein